ncbi:MAG: PAS domain S-box protein [Nitrosomonadales bacterium]|nr:PAS domain S-box protein [Nitrosomonadales bacterium]
MTKYPMKDFFNSPRGGMLSIALLIMAAEFLIMVLIEIILKPIYGSTIPEIFWEFMDPVLLIIIVTPWIYVVTVRPREKQQALLQQQFNELSITAVTFDSREGVVVTDANNKILKVNHAFTEITGYSNEEVIGQTPGLLNSGRHDPGFYRDMWKILVRDKFWCGEIWNRKKNGAIYPEWLAITAVLGADGQISNYVGLFSDISERKASEQQLRKLTAHIQAAREEEKTRIAREIHDDLGGTLTALKMETYHLTEELSGNEPSSPQERVESMTQLIDHAVGVTRRVISDLHPTVIDDLGLVAALEWQCKQFGKRTGIACEVICADDRDEENKLDKTTAINLFRICQEALTNVARHSGASRVNVEYHQDDAEIMLSICDNGHGLPEGHTIAQTSYGMRGMCERVAQLDGKVAFDSPSGGGLRVTVTVPCRA